MRDLWKLLFSSPSGLPVGTRVRLHPGLAALLPALAAALLAAETFRLLVPSPEAELEWNGFGFLDKRWLVLRYWGCVAAALFAPLVVLRRHACWAPAEASAEGDGKRAGLRVLLVLAAVTVWLGPPWNLELLARPMEWHEIVHLGPLQALLVGKSFYTESGTQYGPGLQLLSLVHMQHSGVTLLSLREFWLWTNLAGALLIVAWMARLFGPLAVALGLVVFRVLSPLYFFRATGAGSYDFAFGSASCLRYAGAIHAILAFTWVLGRDTPGARARPADLLFLLGSGALWGVFVQLSQENLGCGVAGLGLLALFAWLARVAPLRRLLGLGLAFGSGALLVCLPTLVWFSWTGEIDLFLRRYFEVGALVARGYSNTAFAGAWSSPEGILYLSLPLAALLVFAVGAFDTRAARSGRMAAVGAALAALACFATALLRSDRPHILAAATPAALLVAAAVQGLRSGRIAPASRLVLAAVLLPFLLCLQQPQLKRFLRDALGKPRALLALAEPRESVGGRVGYRYELDRPYSVFSGLPLGEFLRVTSRLRELIGSRPVVISSAIGTKGHWYFFADLVPLMPDPEPSMTIVNAPMRARYLAELTSRGIPCLVATSPGDAELRIARAEGQPREEWLLRTSELDFLVSCRKQARQRAQRAGGERRAGPHQVAASAREAPRG